MKTNCQSYNTKTKMFRFGNFSFNKIKLLTCFLKKNLREKKQNHNRV